MLDLAMYQERHSTWRAGLPVIKYLLLDAHLAGSALILPRFLSLESWNIVRPLDWLPLHPLGDPTWMHSHRSHSHVNRSCISYFLFPSPSCTQFTACQRGSPDWHICTFLLSSRFLLGCATPAGSRLSLPFKSLREHVYFQPHPFPGNFEWGVGCSSDSSYSYEFTTPNQRS